ncbi:hypothetical protein [Absidia glauca]|uniref:ABC transporter domain-containing protein n=1 Tax=Absidia glauca TaxID=4829 RepID=A0A163KQ95_ABSGL|nr:hypothetical protein [Absidia glauca]
MSDKLTRIAIVSADKLNGPVLSIVWAASFVSKSKGPAKSRTFPNRSSANSFELHRLPVPRPGQVLGLVGTNGIGISTALKILSGKMKPNLGNFEIRNKNQVATTFSWALDPHLPPPLLE